MTNPQPRRYERYFPSADQAPPGRSKAHGLARSSSSPLGGGTVHWAGVGVAGRRLGGILYHLAQQPDHQHGRERLLDQYPQRLPLGDLHLRLDLPGRQPVQQHQFEPQRQLRQCRDLHHQPDESPAAAPARPAPRPSRSGTPRPRRSPAASPPRPPVRPRSTSPGPPRRITSR